jgi:type I restriction enzyme M protein
MVPTLMTTPSGHVSFIWSIAELLRGDFKQSEYGRVVLPFTGASVKPK